MNRRYLGRRILSTIHNLCDSALFWNRIIAIILGVIAVELFIIVSKDDDNNSIPVYVVGGSVDVDNVVEGEGAVDVNNTVRVNGMVCTY